MRDTDFGQSEKFLFTISDSVFLCKLAGGSFAFFAIRGSQADADAALVDFKVGRIMGGKSVCIMAAIPISSTTSARGENNCGIASWDITQSNTQRGPEVLSGQTRSTPVEGVSSV